MYLQPAGGEDGARVEWLARTAAELAAGGFDGFSSSPPRAGSLVLAQFSGDGLWYRGHVEAVVVAGAKKDARVFFIDFGNSELVPIGRVRPLTGGPAVAAAFSAVKPLAAPAALAYVRVPELSDALHGEAAAEALAAFVAAGGKLSSQTVRTVRPTAGAATAGRDAVAVQHVILFPEGSSGDLAHSINAQMLEAGMARLPAAARTGRAAADDVNRVLRVAQEEALRQHVGIFRYGDPGDSDDEDDRR
jgi:staphylococcal nuclease domain-containing protein 1